MANRSKTVEDALNDVMQEAKVKIKPATGRTRKWVEMCVYPDGLPVRGAKYQYGFRPRRPACRDVELSVLSSLARRGRQSFSISLDDLSEELFHNYGDELPRSWLYNPRNKGR
ncbi:MAG: hypothetical protein ABH877_02480 [bacterium]